MKPPRNLTVLVDTREKNPILFPRSIALYPDRSETTVVHVQLTIKKSLMDAADYCLEEYPTCCGIERKSGINELGSNLLTKDYGRFTRALDRLASTYSHPYLMLEGSFNGLCIPQPHVQNPDLVIDALTRVLLERSIPLLLVGRCNTIRTRVMLGGYITRIMLVTALHMMSPQPKAAGAKILSETT